MPFNAPKQAAALPGVWPEEVSVDAPVVGATDAIGVGFPAGPAPSGEAMVRDGRSGGLVVVLAGLARHLRHGNSFLGRFAPTEVTYVCESMQDRGVSHAASCAK